MSINYESYIGPRSQKNTKHTLQHIVDRRKEDDEAYKIKDTMESEEYAKSFPYSVSRTAPELYMVPVEDGPLSKATEFEYWLVWYKTLNYEPHMWYGRNYDQHCIVFPYHRRRITEQEYWDYKLERVSMPAF